MDLKLKGNNALITGGTKGIGRAIADALADEGCNVAICARTDADVQQAVKALALARRYLKDEGIDFGCVPEMVDLEVEGVERTGDKLRVERR